MTKWKISDFLIHHVNHYIDWEEIIFTDKELAQDIINKIKHWYQIYNQEQEDNIDLKNCICDLSLLRILELIQEDPESFDLDFLTEVVVYIVYETLTTNQYVKSGMDWNDD